MDMTMIYLMFGGISFFVLFLFIYMINRDKAIETKFAGIEMALENIFSELDSLKKEVKSPKAVEALQKLETMMEKIVHSMKVLEDKNRERISRLENKLKSIEMNVKESKMPQFMQTINENDSKKIKELKKQGYSVEEISRELRMPIGEVELALKFS